MNYLNAILLFVFFCSGLASLTLQTVWIRTLSLSVGSTSTAMGIVLGIFFGGLGIGGYYGGKLSSKVKEHLKVYAWIEAAVGLYALLIFFPLNEFHIFLRFLNFGESFAVLNAVIKFSLVGICILGPAIGMGITLPLLVKFIQLQNNSAGKTVSVLYGVNTLGAVAGAFCTSYFFIPYIGVDGANFLGIAVYFIAALMIYGLHLKYSALFSRVIENETYEKPTKNVSPNSLFLLIAFVTGFSAIGFEVIWTKYLTVFLGTNIFGIGMVLALFLLGIALGSLLVSRWIDKFENLKLAIGVTLAFTAFVCFAVTGLLNIAPKMSLTLQVLLSDIWPVSTLFAKSFVSGVIMFPATLLFGILFPLIVKAMTNDEGNVSVNLGQAYGVNTLGSILASMGLGLFVLPSLGSHVASMIAIVPLVVAGVWVWSTQSKVFYSRVLPYALGVLLLLGSWSIQPSFTNIIKSAYFSSTQFKSVPEVLSAFNDDEKYLEITEGKSAITSLSIDKSDGENFQRFLRLKTNGLNESIYDLDNIDVFPRYEALLGMLPYLFSKDINSSFIVGYGGGFTVDFLSQTDLDLVQVAELEQGIMDAAEYVHKNNNPITARKNVKLQIEDARFVLATKQRGPFDIIVSQPSHSWLAGVANLFTEDFFEIVSENLTKGGVYGQWLNLYNIDPVAVQSILKTFFTVFEHGAVFTNPEDQEMIIVGSHEPLKLNKKRFDSLVSKPEMKRKLRNVPADSINDVLSFFAMTRQEVVSNFKEVPMNTDLNAYAEVRQSRLFYSDQNQLDSELKEFFSEHYPKNILSIRDSLQYLELDSFALLKSSLEKDQFEKIYSLRKSVLSLMPMNKDQKLAKGELLFKSRMFEESVVEFEQLMNTNPSSEYLNWVTAALMEQSKYKNVKKMYDNHKNYADTLTKCYVFNAATNLKENDLATSLLAELLQYKEKAYESCGEYFYKIVGIYYYNNNDLENALVNFEQYYEIKPDDLEVLDYLVKGYEKNGLKERSIAFKNLFGTIKFISQG